MEITVSVVAMIIPCYHIIILDSVGPHKMVVVSREEVCFKIQV